ncbi:MAG: hypothetical protein ACK5NK_02400 [Niabella sp.]
MKKLKLNQMECIQAGKKSAAEWVGCSLAVAGWGLTFASLVTMGPVGALAATSVRSAVLTAAGYSVSTAGLMSCF